LIFAKAHRRLWRWAFSLESSFFGGVMTVQNDSPASRGSFQHTPQRVAIIDLISVQTQTQTQTHATRQFNCRAVLQHLRDPLRGLRRLFDAVRPGGWLLVEELVFLQVDLYNAPFLQRFRAFNSRGIRAQCVAPAESSLVAAMRWRLASWRPCSPSSVPGSDD
jgi:hypothetical protein